MLYLEYIMQRNRDAKKAIMQMKKTWDVKKTIQG